MPFDSDIDYDEPIPVFPLGQLVLLPHAAVPLHIFEPRYREMARDALRGEKLIAMAVFDPEENWAEQYGEAPPLRPCVCVGRIVEHQELPDGRYQPAAAGTGPGPHRRGAPRQRTARPCSNRSRWTRRWRSI